MKRAKTKVVLLVFGEGGHNAQMLRLCETLEALNRRSSKLVALTDSSECRLPANVIEHYSLAALRHKHEKNGVRRYIHALFSAVKTLIAINRQYQVRSVISTGPGIAILPSLLFRLIGVPIVHIETWSRFYTQSLAGKFMYRIANKFYIQNQEQRVFYPKAIWGGRL